MEQNNTQNQDIVAQYGPREAMEYDVVIVGVGLMPGSLMALCSVAMSRLMGV